ncbi:hypothetical protein LCGC14_2093250 [marine sediment metagenome]|uniref:Uncharacterized protein n=1 Tax=marine sediment metagenome TaxID=412755 RepID=A0A0F9H8X5_9ZZZZ
MTWVRLDDGFSDHPKVLVLPSDAIVLHLAGLCYCARQETDGAIPNHVLTILSRFSSTRTKKLAGELVQARVWEENGTGYIIHDYLDYNPSHKSLEERREKKRRAGQAGGLAKAKQSARKGG